MGSEKNEAEKATESQEGYLDRKVGDIEREKLEAVPITVKSVSVEIQTKKDTGKNVGKMLHLMCKHPGKEELIDMSKILYRKTEEEGVKELGLWYNEDKEGNIQKGSPVAVLMGFCSVAFLRDLEGKELQTKLNKEGYLSIKAY